MSKNKIRALVLVVLVVLSISIFALILNARNTSQDEGNVVDTTVKEYVVKDGYKEYVNNDFGYRYQYPENKVNTTNKADNYMSVLGGNLVHVNPDEIKGYQIPGIDITVFSSALMSNMDLSKWVKSSTVTNINDLSSSNGKQFFSTKSFLTINNNESIFLIDEHPFLNGKTPTILINNGTSLIQIQGLYRPFNEFYDFISTFEYKKDNEYQKFSQSELDRISDYFNNYENL